MSSPRLSLATLPTDIIRMIVRAGLNDIDELRLISPRWNILAIECLNNRTHLPQISNILWQRFARDNVMTFDIPSAYRTYFGIGKWINGVILYNFKDLRVNIKNVKARNFKNQFFQLFERCSHIERFEFADLRQLKYTKDAILDVTVKDIVIRDVFINFKDAIRSRILEVVEIYSTEQLSLEFILDDYRGEFSTDLLTFVNDSRLTVSSIQLKFHLSVLYSDVDLLRSYWEPRMKAIEVSSNFKAVRMDGHGLGSVYFALTRK